MWYLIEAIAFAVIIAIILIVYKIKEFKGLKECIILASSVLIILFGVTFVLEKPNLKITESISYEIKTHKSLDNIQAYYHFANVSNKEILIKWEVIK